MTFEPTKVELNYETFPGKYSARRINMFVEYVLEEFNKTESTEIVTSPYQCAVFILHEDFIHSGGVDDSKKLEQFEVLMLWLILTIGNMKLNSKGYKRRCKLSELEIS